MINGKLPGMLFGFGFIGSALILISYLLISKFFLRSRTDRRVIRIIMSIGIAFFVLGVISGIVNVSQR